MNESIDLTPSPRVLRMLGEIDFKDKYEGRRINCTYLFGSRTVKQKRA